MKFSLRATAEAVLALTAVCLVAVLVIPWREQPLLPGPGGRRADLPAVPEQARRSPARAEPEALISLFVPRAAPRSMRPSAPAQALPAATTEKKPTDAPWLAYLGYSSGAEGGQSYYFKDTRSGRVIKVTQGETAGDWTLVGVTEGRMILQNKGETYAVNKR